MVILFLDCFSSAVLLNGEPFSPFPSPLPVAKYRWTLIQMDLQERCWGGGGRCPVDSWEDVAFVISLSLHSRMKTDVSSLHKTLYGLSKHRENSTSADSARFQGWNHLYNEAVALWWILWWNLHPDSCLHAKQMNVHLFQENVLLEICLPDSGSHLGNTFCRRLSALSHD